MRMCSPFNKTISVPRRFDIHHFITLLAFNADMNDLLSGGAISAIFRGEKIRNPVLQILACRKMDPSASNRRFPSNVDRYRLMISDGEHKCTGMLATQLNGMVTRQEVGEKAVIRAKHYSCQPLANNRRLIVVLKLEVVRKGPDVGVTLGNPTLIRNPPESTGTSDAAASSEESPSSSSPRTDAGKGSSQGLICPMCLEGLKNPTLLACGHTFCRVCLERFDKLHRAQTYMPCPVCRKRTKLGKFRVAGLSSNFSLKGLEDGAGGKGKGASAASCSMHSDVYEDILCEVCAGVICIDCLTLKQQDHKIKEKETIEAEVKKKRDAAVQKSQAKKAAIETAIAKAEQDKLDVHSHFERLKREVEGAFEKKVRILKDMEDKLLRTLNNAQKNHDGFFEKCMASPKQSLSIINRALTLLEATQRGHVDLDTRALGVQYGNLENSLATLPEVIFSEKVKDTAEKTRFHPADENVLELGCLQGLPVNTGVGSTTG